MLHLLIISVCFSGLFQGDIQQLLILEDPQAAAKYCVNYIPDCDSALPYNRKSMFLQEVSTPPTGADAYEKIKMYVLHRFFRQRMEYSFRSPSLVADTKVQFSQFTSNTILLCSSHFLEATCFIIRLTKYAELLAEALVSPAGEKSSSMSINRASCP